MKFGYLVLVSIIETSTQSPLFSVSALVDLEEKIYDKLVIKAGFEHYCYLKN